MSALYQRARPYTFDQMVGQEHVKDVLASAVARGLAGHAYLFSGPRGVGKTTTARLLAMAVNCEREDPTERPCGECESCRLVRAGSHPDVVELDAASNNSVDDVRALREQVGLASLRGGTRVWILDEAHMLSRAAANALLKTLEEPPPGLMFVLATTEPEKLPPTILSRCQHFRFRRLTDDEILGKLQRLTQEAGVSAERDALALVARAADGAMRDAESLLERLLVAGGPVTAQDAEDALGLPPRERLESVARALLAADLAKLLPEAGDLYRAGFAPRTVAEQLGRTMRDMLHESLAESGDEDRARLVAVIQALDDEHERFLRKDDLYALEVALIKAANTGGAITGTGEPAAVTTLTAPAEAPASAPRAPQSTSSAAGGKTPTEPRPRTPGASPRAAAPAESGPPSASEEPVPPSDAPAKAAAGRSFSWHAVRTAAPPQLKAFLQPAQVEESGGVVTLTYGENWRFHFDQVVSRRAELESLVEKVAGAGFELDLKGPRGSTGGGRRRRTQAPAPSAATDAPVQEPRRGAPGAKDPPTSERRDEETSAGSNGHAEGREPVVQGGSEARTDEAKPARQSPAEPTGAAPSTREPDLDHPPLDGAETSLYGSLPDDFWESAVAEGGSSEAGPPPREDEPGNDGTRSSANSLSRLQALFPGKVVEFTPKEDPKEAVDAQGPQPDEVEGYDDDDQDRLGFGVSAPDEGI